MFFQCATVIGYVSIGIIVFKIYLSILNHRRRKDFVWDTNNGEYWAVVTGSTDGIGFELARELALKGYNLLMISRNEQKLEDKKQLILNECQNNVQVKTLAVDFKRLDIYEKIAKFLDGHDIFILVNNVGFGGSGFKIFAEEETSFHDDIINVNLMSVVKMTEICLPDMIQKRRGLILNVSSITSFHNVPGYNIYSATKAFVTSFSRSLFNECQAYNVLVFNLTPGPVDTKLLPVKSNSAPTPQKYVQCALPTINWTTPESFGCLHHTLQSSFFNCFEFLFDWQSAAKFRMNIVLFSEKTKRFDYTLVNLFEFTKYLFNVQHQSIFLKKNF